MDYIPMRLFLFSGGEILGKIPANELHGVNIFRAKR
jgi:hypothetical protein